MFMCKVKDNNNFNLGSWKYSEIRQRDSDFQATYKLNLILFSSKFNKIIDHLLVT